MLDRISTMVESTKKALSSLQEESPSPIARETSARPPPCHSLLVPPPPHLTSSVASIVRSSSTDLPRFDHVTAPPSLSPNPQNFSFCNAPPKNMPFLQSATFRAPSNEYPQADSVNSIAQKDSNLRLEMRNSQLSTSPASSSPFAMRPSAVPSPKAMQKDSVPPLNSSLPPVLTTRGYAHSDVMSEKRMDAPHKELAASSNRESIPMLSNYSVPTFPTTSSAQEKIYQDNAGLKSTNTTSRSPMNLSVSQRLISQPANVSDPEVSSQRMDPIRIKSHCMSE